MTLSAKSLSPKSLKHMKWMPKVSGDPTHMYSRDTLLRCFHAYPKTASRSLLLKYRGKTREKKRRPKEFENAWWMHSYDGMYGTQYGYDPLSLADACSVSASEGGADAVPYLQKMWAQLYYYENGERYGCPITSLVLCNVPTGLTPHECVDILREHPFGEELRLLYLACDAKKESQNSGAQNCGTCIVNFATEQTAQQCFEVFNGRTVGTETVKVFPARLQGIEWNLEELRHDPVLEKLDADSSWRPLMLQNGEPVPFTVGRRSSKPRDQRETKDGSPRVNRMTRAPCGPVNPEEHSTVMLRNIPNKYTRTMFYERIQELFEPLEYNFIYMPLDFFYECNVGYAFINFRTSQAVRKALDVFHNVECHKALPGFNSHKIVELTPARVQGLENNIAHFQKSHVLGYIREGDVSRDWAPLIFDDGVRVPFPTLKKDADHRWHGTTVTISNIPQVCTRDTLVEALNDAQLKGAYDLVHMPYKGDVHCGHATVNFRHPQGAMHCGAFFNGKKAMVAFGIGNAEILQVCTAIAQGFGKNMDKSDSNTLIFDANGDRISFPIKSMANVNAAMSTAAASFAQSFTPEIREWQLSQITRHIEYYFSEDNLPRDVFLRSNMDSEGYVLVDVLLRFPTLTKLSTTRALIADSVKSSSLLDGIDLDNDNRKGRVRIRDEVRRKKWL